MHINTNTNKNFFFAIAFTFFYIVLTLVPLVCVAQEASNQVLANSLGIKPKDFPFLGMKVLSVNAEENKHVLMSNNGRYIITGTVQDLWDGVDRSFIEVNPINTKSAEQVFKHIDKDDLAIVLGNNAGTPIDIFLSYSCKQCKLLAQQIMDKKFLKRFKVNIFVVYASDFDENIAKDIFCGQDKRSRFLKRFVERDISDLETSCSPNEPRMAVTYANVLPVRSLPATLSYKKTLLYGALPENF